MEGPTLFTFDIFGTVIDWWTGLRQAAARYGKNADRRLFEQLIDFQGKQEQRPPFRNYQEISAESFAHCLELQAPESDQMAAELGNWPLFEDSAAALRRLIHFAPCVAMTNSDRVHGEQVQAQLGFRLSDWICAEEVRCYKPELQFWRAVASKRGRACDKSWWHVSAYGDYDLEVARSLGLSCALIQRPHCRPGPADLVAPTLTDLADQLQSLFGQS
jgi:2-haloalkanoic acid dehalogenase type II